MKDKTLTDNEIVKASENTEVKKIKAIYPHIVVGGSADKPCYSIDWFNIETKTMHTGYSSYNLKTVQEWLKEYFEVVEDDIENLINRQKAENENLNAKIKSIYKELQRIALMTVATDSKEMEGGASEVED